MLSKILVTYPISDDLRQWCKGYMVTSGRILPGKSYAIITIAAIGKKPLAVKPGYVLIKEQNGSIGIFSKPVIAS